MPTRKPTTSKPTREPCPACDWFSRRLEHLGFRPGDRLRVVESERLVLIVPGDPGTDRNESSPWPAALAAAAATPNPPKKERR